LVVDIDGVLVLAHSEKQDAAVTWKKTFGHHPLFAFVDHGREGSGEPVAALLRPGDAGSNTAADHIEAARLALAQLPKKHRRGHRTLIRTDSDGGTHEPLNWLTQQGQWLSYSVGMGIIDAVHQAVLQVPDAAWTSAVEPDGEIRDGPGWSADRRGCGCLSARNDPTSAPSWDHGRRWDAHHLLRHQHLEHADRTAGTAAPSARQGRGPHPGSPRYRPAQPW
jgi:hypothetical protein